MGTPALIAVQIKDNEYKATQINWDGYLSHVGNILLEKYNTWERALELINKGELRCFKTDDDGNIIVETYDDDDYYPVTTSKNNLEYHSYNYLYRREWNPKTSKIEEGWMVSFSDYDDDTGKETEYEIALEEAISKFGERH